MMPESAVYPLIFTDLDGTLLDHDSYSAKPADLLIQRMVAHSIATIIPITSKTRAELRSLQNSIQMPETISVTENGSVIHIPDGFLFAQATTPQNVLAGIGYTEILDHIAALPTRLRQHITGFDDMSVAEVAAATGLEVQEAERAKLREASEPFLWSGSDAALEELGRTMAEDDIRIQRGGRFYHFTGHATKQQAMALIKSAFVERENIANIISIALGDGPNDLEMIEAADFGVIMPNPGGVTIQSNELHVRIAPAAGPKGWVMAISELFTELGIILPES